MEVGKLEFSVDSSAITKAADEMERFNLATSKMIELREKLQFGDVMTSDGWISVIIDRLYEEALNGNGVRMWRNGI